MGGQERWPKSLARIQNRKLWMTLFPINQSLEQIRFFQVRGFVGKSQVSLKIFGGNITAVLSAEFLAERHREYFYDVVSAGNLPTIVALLVFVRDLCHKSGLVQVMLLTVVYDIADHFGQIDP